MSPESRILSVVVPTVTVLIHIDLSVHGDSSGDSASASSVAEVEAVAEGSCEAVVARPRGPMHRHGLLSSLLRHGLRTAMASRAPSSALVLRNICSDCSRALTPPPRWYCYSAGCAFREGELCPSSVVCSVGKVTLEM